MHLTHDLLLSLTLTAFTLSPVPECQGESVNQEGAAFERGLLSESPTPVPTPPEPHAGRCPACGRG